MEVILLKDVEKVGGKGEVIQVKSGFGRNYLLPRGLAMPASRENRVFVEEAKKRSEKRRLREKEELQKIAEKAESLKLRIEVAVGEKDKLFGSVTAQDLAEALSRDGISVDRKQIRLPEPIRSLGTHTVILDLHPEVKPRLTVEVVKK